MSHDLGLVCYSMYIASLTLYNRGNESVLAILLNQGTSVLALVLSNKHFKICPMMFLRKNRKPYKQKYSFLFIENGIILFLCQRSWDKAPEGHPLEAHVVEPESGDRLNKIEAMLVKNCLNTRTIETFYRLRWRKGSPE